MGVGREEFRSYMLGWTDRAAGRASKREAFKHREELVREYDRGWDDAAATKRIVAREAAARLGYDLDRAAIDR